MNPLVSIIITSYNHAEYLPQRLESVLNQTLANREIIIVDDASTDGSAGILRKYAGRPGIQLLIKPANEGYARACNDGVSLSRGEYIMFAECDDYDDSRHVETLCSALQDAPHAVVAYCRSKIVDEQGRVLGDDYRCRERVFKKLSAGGGIIPKRMMQRLLLCTCVIPNMSAALIRKNAFEAVGGLSSEYRACADWDFWLRMSFLGDFYYSPNALNCFRTHKKTVRNTFAFSLQISEMFSLISRSAARMSLSAAERFRFRLNLGYVWAFYIVTFPKEGIARFAATHAMASRYERLILVFLVPGLIRTFYKRLHARFLRNRS